MAQSTRTIRVKAGDDLAQAYSSHGFYRFPAFSKATLYYKGGSRNEGQLFNYNILSGNMQFVGPKGDTLDLGGQANIDSAVFDKTSFLYNDGWMEVAARADSLALLKKIIIKTQVENIGAYGVASATASIDNIKSYSTGTGVYNLVLNQDVVIVENISWFFKDQNKNITKASKSVLLKSLSAPARAKADAYLKQNKVNFEKEADLRKLMQAVAN
ncbi:MAG: hypothetical protein Q8941_13750 [Bacteroidota bacterium]|nr:hypothetical protein [Bacteroidota bacterium]